jgi:hypothetical protein
MFEIGEIVRCGGVVGQIVGVRYDRYSHYATWTIAVDDHSDEVITAETDEIETL